DDGLDELDGDAPLAVAVGHGEAAAAREDHADGGRLVTEELDAGDALVDGDDAPEQTLRRDDDAAHRDVVVASPVDERGAEGTGGLERDEVRGDGSHGRLRVRPEELDEPETVALGVSELEQLGFDRL